MLEPAEKIELHGDESLPQLRYKFNAIQATSYQSLVDLRQWIDEMEAGPVMHSVAKLEDVARYNVRVAIDHAQNLDSAADKLLVLSLSSRCDPEIGKLCIEFRDYSSTIMDAIERDIPEQYLPDEWRTDDGEDDCTIGVRPNNPTSPVFGPVGGHMAVVA